MITDSSTVTYADTGPSDGATGDYQVIPFNGSGDADDAGVTGESNGDGRLFPNGG